MEGKKSMAAIRDELFERKEGMTSSDFFTNIFPPPLPPVGKEASSADLYDMLNKQRAEAQLQSPNKGSSPVSDHKPQGSPKKSPTAYSKDGKTFYAIESAESPTFGSSVHYGGRDFYAPSQAKHSPECAGKYKEDKEEGSGATRGDWWQGSLYY